MPNLIKIIDEMLFYQGDYRLLFTTFLYSLIHHLGPLKFTAIEMLVYIPVFRFFRSLITALSYLSNIFMNVYQPYPVSLFTMNLYR